MAVADRRYLSQIFSPPVFKKIIANDYAAFDSIVLKHFPKRNGIVSNTHLIQKIYSDLNKNYRCEYIYKSLIFKEILKKYSLNTTVSFNEFKVADSKADLLLINGVAKVYEVKTELDDFSKLNKQLADYKKVAQEVYVVTEEKQSEKLSALYQNSNVGIISLKKSNKLQTVKEAVRNEENFEFEALFKLLRKDEYLHLVKLNFNFIPDVPNTKIFRICFELLQEINIKTFQMQVLKVLKQRKLQCSHLLLSDQTPFELRFICNTLDLNENEYESLYNFLNNNHLCINPILEENNSN